ncbi:hypothetical protein EZ313_03285 [Ramlibacter henchirensis]|uniref:UspA domain-containing protein n=1 Tax=Ramlibacter henchirensis TaxID=204072 RepID=A0A4Z0C6I2_9BURK|nr:universal stress protein [Ramlibacter henchirensis]TFZ05699.1 hypothetical protein EZ313_03285 [Ramlibacter henchirensis]
MGAIPLSGQTLELFHPIRHDPVAPPAPDDAQSPFLAGRCVVVLSDTTLDGINAVWRAALIARDLGMPMHLLQVNAGEDLPSARARAGRLARQAQHRLGVAAAGNAAQGDVRELLAGLAPPPGLVVLPYERGNAFTECLFGTAAERLFRSVFMPTLVVRRPASARYRRVLVPVTLDDAAAALIGAAQRISRDPRIRVMHVLGTSQEQTLRIADAPEHSLRMQRQRRSSDAYRELNRLIAGAGALERAAALVSFGHPAMRVLEVARASRSQLVVVGKQKGSILGQLLADGVCHRVISEGSADVLMLPLPDREGPLRKGCL